MSDRRERETEETTKKDGNSGRWERGGREMQDQRGVVKEKSQRGKEKTKEERR